MSDGPTSTIETDSPNTTVEVARAENGKPMFTDSVANRILDVLGGRINTIRLVEPRFEHFGRTRHEIDTDEFLVVLEDRDEFNRTDGEGSTELRYYQKDPSTKEMPLLLTPGATTLFSLQDVTSVEAGKTPDGTPAVTFIQKGPTHNMEATLGRNGHLQVYVNRNPSK